MTIVTRPEHMRGGFEKHHVDGLPIAAAFHHITEPDGDQAHDHPWDFTTHVLAGWYREEVFIIDRDGWWTSCITRRLPGAAYQVQASHIHRIIEVSPGGCWTLVTPGDARRETLFWRFVEGRQAQSRPWHQQEFDT